MIRNAPGQEVCCQMTDLATGNPFTGLVHVWIKRRSINFQIADGFVRYLGGGMVVYYPESHETDTESVTFQFNGTGAKTEAITYEPKPGSITLPKPIAGLEAIARIEFLELIASETPQEFTAIWVNALLQHDPIPLTPGILAGLNRAFPRLFTLHED